MDNILDISNNNIYITIGIVVVIVFVLIYLLIVINKKSKNCKTIESSNDIDNDGNKFIEDFYTINNSIKNDYFEGNVKLGTKTINYDYKLKDFYVKTAYNACASGKFKNDYVDLCALENCAKKGVRGLDFQIYSKNDKPIVAVSKTKTNMMKDSYNELSLDEVMASVKSNFLQTNPNVNGSVLKNDPLFLFFRIHYGSNETRETNDNYEDKLTAFYNNIYSILNDNLSNVKSKFNSIEMGNLYDDNDKARMISLMNMKDTKNKIFLFVSTNDVDTSIIKKSNLNNIVDIYMDDINMKQYRITDLNSNDKISISTDNKRNLSICYPDWEYSLSTNYNFLSPMSLGVQFVAMNFQNNDQNLKNYNKYFIQQYGNNSSSNKTSPFIKKPDTLIAFPSELTSFFSNI